MYRGRIVVSVGELDGLLGDLARIFAKVPMGFCVFDTELRYRYLNAALADRNGHTVEAHLGRRISDIYPKLAKAGRAGLARGHGQRRGGGHRCNDRLDPQTGRGSCLFP